MSELRQLELAKRQHELCEVDSVRLGMTQIGAQVRQALEALPDRLADELAAESNPHRVHSRLTVEIDQVLAALADELAKDVC